MSSTAAEIWPRPKEPMAKSFAASRTMPRPCTCSPSSSQIVDVVVVVSSSSPSSPWTTNTRVAPWLRSTPSMRSAAFGSATPTTSFTPSFPNVFTAIPAGVTGSTDITTISPDFANLYSINANFSVSRELTPTTALTASYLYTGGRRLPVYRNINVVPGGTFLADGRPIFGTARYYAGFGNITSAESVGDSLYNGLNLTLRRQLAPRPAGSAAPARSLTSSAENPSAHFLR